jgi:hypothetical protein
MKDFEFFIFGVPEGFNLQNSTSENLSFFETFYDSSKERVKFNIQKTANGYVTYTYLRYLILSAQSGSEGGRKNSFLGMSIRVKNHYCNDPMRLYKLMDRVYLEVILKDETILREFPENKNNIQAQFLISKFSDADLYIEKLRKLFANNLETKFDANFLPLRTDNNKAQKNVSLKLHIDKSSEDVNIAFQEYSNINISPDYVEVKAPTISDEEIEDLEKSVIKLRNLSLQLFSGITHKSSDWNAQFTDLKKVYENKKTHINNFQNNDRIKKLKPHYDQIAKTIKELNELNNRLSIVHQDIPDNPVINYTWREHFSQAFKFAPIIFKAFLIAALPLVFVVGYLIGIPSSKPVSSCEGCEEIIEDFQTALESQQFTKAASLLLKLEDLEQDITEFQKQLETTKIEYYFTKADEQMKLTIDCLTGAKMIDSYNSAKDIIEKNTIHIDRNKSEEKIHELKTIAVEYYFKCYDSADDTKKTSIISVLENNFLEVESVNEFIKSKTNRVIEVAPPPRSSRLDVSTPHRNRPNTPNPPSDIKPAQEPNINPVHSVPSKAPEPVKEEKPKDDGQSETNFIK